ncbi:MAG TPA: MarR family transcriptional regulator [Tepidisphaeraceae bacterium]|jgi:DNA-binding MarR family transcriptional regulator
MGINLIQREIHREAQILDEIRRLVRFLRVSARGAEKQLGISGAQLFILQTLAQSDGALSVNNLAERTRTHQSSVSVVVQKLVQQRLVKRAKASTDGRQLALTLTPQARALLKRSPYSAQHRLIEALGEMPSRQQKILGELLRKVNTSLGLDDAVPPLLFEEEGALSRGLARR